MICVSEATTIEVGLPSRWMTTSTEAMLSPSIVELNVIGWPSTALTVGVPKLGLAARLAVGDPSAATMKQARPSTSAFNARSPVPKPGPHNGLVRRPIGAHPEARSG